MGNEERPYLIFQWVLGRQSMEGANIILMKGQRTEMAINSSTQLREDP